MCRQIEDCIVSGIHLHTEEEIKNANPNPLATISDLALSLLYRAVNTERNLILSYRIDGHNPLTGQEEAIEELIALYEKESERRYESRLNEIAHAIVNDEGPYG